MGRHHKYSTDSCSESYDYDNSHKHKRSCSSSSSSSFSSDEKKIMRKVDKVEKKLEKNYKKDKCLAKSEQMLEKRVWKLEKKLRKAYKLYKYRLRREKCLMVNGCDAYGSFSNNVAQTIANGDSIIFATDEGSLNISLLATDIQVHRDGVYKYEFTCQFNEASLLAIYINGVERPETRTGSNSGANIVAMQQLLYLHAGDILSVRSLRLTSVTTAVGFDIPSQNVDITLVKIAPLPEKCCIPPPLFEHSCSDSDSSSSEECHKSSPKCHKSSPKKPQNNNVKDNKEVKETKETKETKEVKETKDNKDNKNVFVQKQQIRPNIRK
jgi:hypothetical protein